MGKLGKKKLVEQAEIEEKQKNGNANAATAADENDSNKDADREKRGGSSVSHSSSQKRSNATAPVVTATGGDKKRKAAAAIKVASASASADTESDDSDDLPLNGASKSGVPPKKQRKMLANAKPKAAATKLAAKKAKSTEQESDEEDADNEKEYEVEAIVGNKTVRGATLFCVRWKGYGANDDTWELESDLNCDDLIQEYRKKAQLDDGAKPAKGQRGRKPKALAAVEKRGRKKAAGTQEGGGGPGDANKEWAVERIIDYVKDDENGELYRIRWKGYAAKDDTWEPESNLSCHGLIERFKKGLEQQRNVDAKLLRESPRKTKRLVNETAPRSSLHNRIGRTSKRSAVKNRVFYGEE